MSTVISSGILYLPIVCECVPTSLTFSIETGHSTHDQRSEVVSYFMSSHYIMYGFMENAAKNFIRSAVIKQMTKTCFKIQVRCGRKILTGLILI